MDLPPFSETPPATIRSYLKSDVYWEGQEACTAHGAVHAINNVLQRPATNNAEMHQAAARLADADRTTKHPSPLAQKGRKAGPEGNLTIKVMQWVLERQPEGLSLVDARNPSVSARIATEPHGEIGYIINPGGALASA